MRRTRRLTTRILGTATLAVLLSFGAQALFVNWLLLNQVMVHLVRTLGVVDEREMARCEASPATWTLGRADTWDAWAYDPATLTSPNPAAPPLDPLLVTRRSLGESDPVRLIPSGPWGGLLLLDQRRAGPCGLIELRWGTSEDGRLTFLAEMAGIGLGVAVLAATLAMRLAVRPLVQRVEALGEAARAVGSDAFVPPAHPEPEDDVFGPLQRVLGEAHARIRDDVRAREDAWAARERHLARIAHDLRTPLASARLALEERLDASPDPALRSALADLVYLSLLTENLRLQARREHGATEAASRLDLAALVQRVADRYARLGALLGVEVVCARPDDALPVDAPAVEVEQALSNLVHNAVRHHPHATGDVGHVALVLEREGSTFTLAVADDGAGMPEEAVGRLSGAPQDPTPEPARADGLGLDIVRDVMRGAGWSLEVATGGGGTEVRIRGDLARP